MLNRRLHNCSKYRFDRKNYNKFCDSKNSYTGRKYLYTYLYKLSIKKVELIAPSLLIFYRISALNLRKIIVYQRQYQLVI